MYTDYDKLDHRTRVQAYLKAMEELAQTYPDDDEAQIYLRASRSNVAASPTDKTYANQLKGAAILEPIFKRQPQHPGVAHYLIHLYDYPAIAEKGLDAAKRYAKIAPAAPHAQHMPSHIFTRVGYWKESVASNIASRASRQRPTRRATTNCTAMDYMVYAYLQTRPGQEARSAVIDEMARPAAIIRMSYAGAFRARRPARRATWWSAAIGRARRSCRSGRPSSPMSMAITHFARALGAARSGNPDAAKADIAKLAELRDKLREAKDAYWSEQVDIQWQVATAWVLYAEGKSR